jgi:hypothetical protein
MEDGGYGLILVHVVYRESPDPLIVSCWYRNPPYKKKYPQNFDPHHGDSPTFVLVKVMINNFLSTSPPPHPPAPSPEVLRTFRRGGVAGLIEFVGIADSPSPGPACFSRVQERGPGGEAIWKSSA